MTERDTISIAHDGPAVLTNIFRVDVNRDSVRIAFMETDATGKDPVFRTAVAMNTSNSIEMAVLILKLHGVQNLDQLQDGGKL